MNAKIFSVNHAGIKQGLRAAEALISDGEHLHQLDTADVFHALSTVKMPGMTATMVRLYFKGCSRRWHNVADMGKHGYHKDVYCISAATM